MLLLYYKYMERLFGTPAKLKVRNVFGDPAHTCYATFTGAITSSAMAHKRAPNFSVFNKW